MKVYVAFLFVLLSFSVCTSAPEHSAEARQILNLLPASIALSAAVSPGSSTTACQGLWQQEGYLCDAGKLLVFAKADQALMLEFHDKDVKFWQIIEKVKNDAMPWIQKFVKQMEMDAERLKEICAPEHKVNFMRASKKCWDTISKFRNSALCTVCSAQNYERFLKGKAAISSESCSLILDDGCAEYLRILVINEPLLHKIAKTAAPILGVQEEMTKVEKEDEKDGHRDLKKLLERRVAAKNSGDAMKAELLNIEAEICEKTLRLTQLPIMGKYLNSNIKLTNIIVDAFEKKKLQVEAFTSSPDIANMISDFGFRRRLLTSNWMLNQGAGSDFKPDGMVHVIKPSDNMFSSHIGAAGNSHQTEHMHRVKPMNCSMAFP